MSSTTMRSWRRYRSVPIVYRIGVAFVLGSVFGLVVGQPATALQPLGDLFVNLLSMLIVPIVVFAAADGARRLAEQPRQDRWTGGRAVRTHLGRSGRFRTAGREPHRSGANLELGDAEAQTAEAPDIVEVILGIVPQNPIGAMASGDILPTIFFVIVFGLALALVEQSTDSADIRNGVESFYDLAEAGAEAMFKVVWGVMEYGVIGVFALMAAVFGEAGVDAIVPFALLIVTLAIAVVVAHIAVVHLGIIIVRLLAGNRRSDFSPVGGTH